MADLVVRVERELRPTVPIRARLELRAFRVRLARSRTARERKRFDRELDTLLGSESYLRAGLQSLPSQESNTGPRGGYSRIEPSGPSYLARSFK